MLWKSMRVNLKNVNIITGKEWSEDGYLVKWREELIIVSLRLLENGTSEVLFSVIETIFSLELQLCQIVGRRKIVYLTKASFILESTIVCTLWIQKQKLTQTPLKERLVP
ncbi:hypothetical protein AVEN_6190-1 [Araneus ventricosus]|uniref:Uncharacterized protein n=1 Tax=Araneus ventricosus TaxID=182803 RepID=A0A4Y2PKL1_ARAVE|nr:hypothetical protein AVEN_6190-1 [Araneus ventricosus]